MNKDGINEGWLVIDLKNDIIAGTPYEAKNFIGNIKVAIEEAEDIADFIDFTNIEIKTNRGEDLQTVQFEMRIRMTIIGDIFDEFADDDDEEIDEDEDDEFNF
jgi:nicotinamidase-related amidase